MNVPLTNMLARKINQLYYVASNENLFPHFLLVLCKDNMQSDFLNNSIPSCDKCLPKGRGWCKGRGENKRQRKQKR